MNSNEGLSEDLEICFSRDPSVVQQSGQSVPEGQICQGSIPLQFVEDPRTRVVKINYT